MDLSRLPAVSVTCVITEHPPSGPKAFIQRGINVHATLSCWVDVDATLPQCCVPAETKRDTDTEVLNHMYYIVHKYAIIL